MSLAPKSQKDFSDPTYWKKFFDKRDTAFEWYGDYSHLSHIFEKYLKLSDRILQIGCGNSQLSEQLYDNGFRNVRSIDTDSKVIKRHKTNNATKRPELVFECKSAAETGLPDGSVNVVLDKGTTDALLPVDYTLANRRLVDEVFAEVERCLQPLGRFLIVTLAQEHIVRAILNHFLAGRRAMVVVQKCELADRDFVMPVFVFVITRLKSALPRVPEMKFFRDASSKGELVRDCDALLKLIEAEQELNWFKHHVTKNAIDDVSIQICDEMGNKRYSLTIVDNPEAKVLRTMAAFIVPLGREADWMFSTAKGRKILRKECARDRIIVVGLYRDQTYQSLNDVQTELGGLVVDLKPAGFGQNKIDFLSLGAVDVTNRVAGGRSPTSGEWSVEQIRRDDKLYRRLIFLSSAGLVQSEAEIVEGKRKGQFQIKSSVLTCDHHRSMLTAINFALAQDYVINGEEIWRARDQPLRIAVLGLGGGLFPRFLYENFQKASITTVELDGEVFTIAQKYFGLPPLKDRFRVLVEDAQKFLQDVSSSSEQDKYEIIFVDLAGPVQTDGLSCPPAAFVTDSALATMRNCLRPTNGVLAFNLVTRDEEKSAEVKQRIRAAFPAVYTINSEEDVNEVLICPLAADWPISWQIPPSPSHPNNGQASDGMPWLASHMEELRKVSVIN